MTARLRVREIDDDEGQRLTRIIRRASGRWWPSGGRRWCCSVRCTRNTKAAARRSSRWASGGRSRRSPSPSLPGMTSRFPHGAWPQLAGFRWPRVVDYISQEGLRALLRQEGVTFQRLKTWKASQGSAVRGEESPGRTPVCDHRPRGGCRDVDPEIVFSVDEFGPLCLQPCPGRRWAPVAAEGARRLGRGCAASAPNGM